MSKHMPLTDKRRTAILNELAEMENDLYYWTQVRAEAVVKGYSEDSREFRVIEETMRELFMVMYEMADQVHDSARKWSRDMSERMVIRAEATKAANRG